MKEKIVDIVKENAKAIVAFVVTVVLAQLVRRGITLDTSVTEAIQTLLMAGIVSGCTWLTRNTNKSGQ